MNKLTTIIIVIISLMLLSILTIISLIFYIITRINLSQKIADLILENDHKHYHSTIMDVIHTIADGSAQLIDEITTTINAGFAIKSINKIQKIHKTKSENFWTIKNMLLILVVGYIIAYIVVYIQAPWLEKKYNNNDRTRTNQTLREIP